MAGERFEYQGAVPERRLHFSTLSMASSASMRARVAHTAAVGHFIVRSDNTDANQPRGRASRAGCAEV